MLHYESPSVNGFFHHLDKAIGVPEWWASLAKPLLSSIRRRNHKLP
ncbi:hypothetical protein C4K37_3831 [Pseudomonas chlororaphis subsp. piscium]|nr:hypothetical protein C4K37_3831 [Pseudomonas chlororaphis subsp. piscium]AZC44764.1 hypothetical protein C4K36_3841 [Pseudomonas chlororaphis subsp. piscium]